MAGIITYNGKPIVVDGQLLTLGNGQDKEVTPSEISQMVFPDAGKVLTSVRVLAADNGRPIEIANAYEMESKLIADNLGRVYHCNDRSDPNYSPDCLYVVEEYLST